MESLLSNIEKLYIDINFVFQGPVLIASTEGGVNIEEIAASNPDAIQTFPIDIIGGLSKEMALDIATKLEIPAEDQNEVAETLMKLYNLFLSKDATMVEINPFAEDANGGKLETNMIVFKLFFFIGFTFYILC